MIAALFSQRQAAPPAIATICLGGGRSTAVSHKLSPQPIDVETDAHITKPAAEALWRPIARQSRCLAQQQPLDDAGSL